jgi:hypothetical protein
VVPVTPAVAVAHFGPHSTLSGWLAQKPEHSAAWISDTLYKYLEMYLGEVGWVVKLGIAVVQSTHPLTHFWGWCSLAAGLQCAQEGTGEVRDVLVSASFRPQLPGLPCSLPLPLHPIHRKTLWMCMGLCEARREKAGEQVE